MSVFLWLKLWVTRHAMCCGGPFDGELRSTEHSFITVRRDGTETTWYNREYAKPNRYLHLGLYERHGRQFLWSDVASATTDEEDRAEKVRRYLEIERIIKETV